MEASFLRFRLLGSQLQRNTLIKCAGASGSPYFRGRCLVNTPTPSMSFSVSSAVSTEHIVKVDRTVNLVQGLAITDYLFQDVAKWADATAMECSLSGRKYTHGQIYKLSRNLGTSLQQMGLGKGDVLAIALPNMPEYPIVTFGAWFARLTVTLVNPTYTPYEIAKQLVDSGTKCIVTLPLFLPLIHEAQNSMPALSQMKIIVIGEPEPDCHTFSSMLQTDSSSANLASSSDPDLNTAEDVILIPYSSGTTGPPKGVMLTQSNLVNNCIQSLDRINATPFTDGNPQEVGMGLLPFFHIMAFQALGLCTFRMGGRVLTLPRFEPETFIDCLKNNKLSIMHMVAPLFNFVNSTPELTAEEFSNMHSIFNGACPTSRVLIDKLLEKAGKFMLVQEGYGLTETSPLTHMALVETQNSRLGSIGPPIPNTLVKVVDPESGKVVGAKEKGELWIKGPQVMKGYFKNEQATKETITEDGWFKTGDIGFYDEDKHFFIVDRLKELIKVKGMQVSPSEVEATLRLHPAVADVAVIGIPSKTLGEAPRAFVVKKQDSVTEQEISNFLKGKLSEHKQLAGGVQFVEAIPKGTSGKILRRELIAQFNEQQGQGQ